ncbi:hypothetical protein [Chryseobacterium populi]|uniref:Uncharacterized protein n=1 Tax=Chryseobacterium populi TaxID=1144316 RepID=J2JZL8_9FLAO|nr:hypothetical protein [Chryseobacterium populi]EJL73335.1 hypothetical protein PMI13_01588 [Chryseobacterium populi]
MAGICIIDDRVDIRGTLENKIRFVLKKKQLDWTIISQDPFLNKAEYLNFINETDIGVLILDERLHESSTGQQSVNYNGSDLVKFLRQYLKNFPIYSITSYHEDDELENQFSQFDEIIAREAFYSKAEEYVERFVRAGQRFLDDHSTQLLKLSELSELIAKGTATEDNLKELRIVQESLNIPFSDYGYPHKESWLRDYEKNISDLATLSDEIENFLKDKSDVEKNS